MQISGAFTELPPLKLSCDVDISNLENIVKESIIVNLKEFQTNQHVVHAFKINQNIYMKYDANSNDNHSQATPITGSIAPAITLLDNERIMLSGGIN